MVKKKKKLKVHDYKQNNKNSSLLKKDKIKVHDYKKD